MNEIRSKIKNDIVIPAADSRSYSMLSAVVTKADEKTNTCNISYTRLDGKKENKNRVPLLLTSNFIDWFPKLNDLVLIQVKDDTIYITGPAYKNYETIRNEKKLKNDIFSSSFMDTLGGFIF